MRLDAPGAPHLGYCSNIHPGETWPEVRANVARFVIAVRDRVAPGRPFGVGLRLGAAAAAALDDPAELDAFRAFLDANGLYVFTVNGFPYGPFHGRPVKERVYRPDWTARERLAYSDRLARLLAALLPPDAVEGSVSTVPGAFRGSPPGAGVRRAVAEHLAEHAAALRRLQAETGRTIVLALEPEPACMLETTAEAVRFLVEEVCAGAGLARFRSLTGLDAARAEAALRGHVGLCLDTCHAAVEFEDPGEAVAVARRAGVRVAKLQLSAGLRLVSPTPALLARLRSFADDVYLHQVVIRRDGGLVRFVDLPPALAAADADPALRAGEWRVHFHVPVFLARLGPLESTQDALAAFLALQAARPIAPHLEVETYCWDVLPAEHRAGDVVAAVARELDWVRRRLAP